MQGIFINGRRPKSKKEIKDQVERINRYLEKVRIAAEGEPNPVDHRIYYDSLPQPDSTEDPYSVVIEATSAFGNEFDGSLAQAYNCMNSTHEHEAPPCHPGPFNFVGPDPFTDRKFYGTVTYNTDKQKWVVK